MIVVVVARCECGICLDESCMTWSKCSYILPYSSISLYGVVLLVHQSFDGPIYRSLLEEMNEVSVSHRGWMRIVWSSVVLLHVVPLLRTRGSYKTQKTSE